MKIPEKKTLAYKNPEHSDRDIQAQLAELEKAICGSLNPPKKKIIGQYMGKDVYEGDVKFDPEKNAYVIDLKDGSAVEVDPKLFSRSANGGKSFDDWYREYAGTRVAGVTARYGKASDNQSKASVHVRTKGKSYYDWNDGKYVDTGKPWEDPLKDARDKASNTVACTDVPPSWAKDGFDLRGKPEVYFHDRWPKKPANVLVDEAIALLRDNKHIDICVRSKDCNMDYRGNHQSVYLSYQINRRYAPDAGKRIVVDVELKQRAFDRMSIELDRYARLRGKWNTDTYVAARIAYILMEAAKLTDGDARGYASDILNILEHTTSPYFIY